MRAPKIQVQGLFEMFCLVLGKEMGYGIGCYNLDFSPMYGGYVIEENLADGAIHHPFGSSRRTFREMIASLHLALSLHAYMKREEIAKNTINITELEQEA